MIINKKTEITCRAVCFMDGARGSYSQIYDLFVDGEPLKVGMVVSSKNRRGPVTNTYTANDQSFDNIKDALECAGHDVQGEVK